MKEAKRMLKGVKKKHPNLDVDAIMAQAQDQTAYPKGLIQQRIQIGGELAGRSIVKTALAMAHRAGIPKSSCQDGFSYLKDRAAPACFGFYYATDLVTNRPADVPLHCASVAADPATGLVLAYVEYFGIHRVVVCMGRGYSGPAVMASYALDPRIGSELHLTVKLAFNESEIEAIYEYRRVPEGSYDKVLANVMPTALKRNQDAERQRAINEAVEYGFQNCGAEPGALLTEEQRRKLYSLIAERLTPFLLHITSPPRLPRVGPEGKEPRVPDGSDKTPTG
jgi:hypothetical protein